PPEQFRQRPRRRLASVEAAGEVPQRSLATTRLVEGEEIVVVVVVHGDEERAVRAPRHAAADLELARRQPRQCFLWPFVLMHMWPSGSIGRWHSGQGGRPAVTSVAARTTNAC